MPIRTVVQGDHPPAAPSVQAALDLLHGPAADLQSLADDLAAGLADGPAAVKIDRPSRLLYATDASLYEMEPVAVVFPRNTADVQHALAVARQRGIPILSRGGGTSLAGQTVNHAIVLDFTPHMSQILEINAGEQWARVQPGVILTELNRRAASHKLLYPIDPSTANRATIGGGIGNNSCGTHSALYGKTIDNVLSIDVVLADGSTTTFERQSGAALETKLAATDLEGDLYRGLQRIAHAQRDEIEKRFPKILRRVSGYNLDEFTGDGPIDMARMIVGSEGTLAIVTEAKVKLVPQPTKTALAAVHFETVVQAAEATLPALEHDPAAVELIDNTIIDRCRESVGFAPLVAFVEGHPGALLLIEFFADTDDELATKLQSLTTDFTKRGLGYAIVNTTDSVQQAKIWQMRQAGLGILMSVKGDAKPVAFVEDTAVDPARLAQFVARFDETVRAHGLTAGYYGHASVGCLHIRPMVNVKTADGLRTMETLAAEIADLVLEFGGSLSGEHGDGIVRGVFTERMFGSQLTQAFRDVKQLFDPDGIFNPGKIVDTPAINDNLRLGPNTVNFNPPTLLDFSADGGLAPAVELCNGQGACRKLDGAMCPSYMVTRDEEHSTRGRANLLRQALNGVLDQSDLTGERIHQALDLCVECKACKSECPSGVDMAKLKYELLTKYHEVHGQTWRNRAFTNINMASNMATRFGARLVPLANTLARLAPARAAMHRFLGIHRDRPLPQLARHTFPAWFQRHTKATAASRGEPTISRGEIVFFDDTFTDYYHPEVGQAAVRILEALGYQVTIVPQLACCGRPAISRGMLATARTWAQRNVEALRPFAERGIPIVGVEPSCLLTLRDEYPELVPGPATTAVANSARLLDELLVELAAQDPDAVAACFRNAPSQHGPSQRILLHGHCHQKAIVGMQPTLDALALVPAYDVELINSACCGMAGSFGFETEHYDISRQMGALALFPAVEAADDGTTIAITGVSCRQQIDHFTSRRSRHSVELLADALRET